jgi:hypothetical protein
MPDEGHLATEQRAAPSVPPFVQIWTKIFGISKIGLTVIETIVAPDVL